MKDLLKVVACIIACVCGIVSCNQSETWQAREREQKAAEAAQWAKDSNPHVIREADGCKVYAFRANPGGPWTYFTRCSSGQTVTQTSWEECHREGKRNVCDTKVSSVEAK